MLTAFWANYGFYVWLLTIVGLIVVGGVTFRLARQLRRSLHHYRTLTAGVDGIQLDQIWQERAQQVINHQDELGRLRQSVSKLEHSSLQHLSLIRFNPFDDVGGDQSFALALLDGTQSGVVISSISSRQGVRTYAKAIQAGQSIHALSDEETSAMTQALGQQPMSKNTTQEDHV